MLRKHLPELWGNKLQKLVLAVFFNGKAYECHHLTRPPDSNESFSLITFLPDDSDLKTSEKIKIKSNVVMTKISSNENFCCK